MVSISRSAEYTWCNTQPAIQFQSGDSQKWYSSLLHLTPTEGQMGEILLGGNTPELFALYSIWPAPTGNLPEDNICGDCVECLFCNMHFQVPLL